MLQIRNLNLFYVVSFILLFLYQFVFVNAYAEEIEIPNQEDNNSGRVNEHENFPETGKWAIIGIFTVYFIGLFIWISINKEAPPVAMPNINNINNINNLLNNQIEIMMNFIKQNPEMVEELNKNINMNTINEIVKDLKKK